MSDGRLLGLCILIDQNYTDILIDQNPPPHSATCSCVQGTSTCVCQDYHSNSTHVLNAQSLQKFLCRHLLYMFSIFRKIMEIFYVSIIYGTVPPTNKWKFPMRKFLYLCYLVLEVTLGDQRIDIQYCTCNMLLSAQCIHVVVVLLFPVLYFYSSCIY